jgi:hypothetical protein
LARSSLLADLGHEVPAALLPSFLASTLSAPASVLGVIEGTSDGLAEAARLDGGRLADDSSRRWSVAVGGCASTARRRRRRVSRVPPMRTLFGDE